MDARRQKETLAGVFGRAAATYDEVGLDYFRTFGRELVRRVGVRPGDDVVDLGAGRGAASLAAAETGAGVVAGDLAPEMVERLATDAAARGLHVDARVMDAEAPGLPDGSADVVLCAFVIFMLPDPGAALAAWRRLLRPGGRLGVTLFSGHDESWSWIGDVIGRPPERPGALDTPERVAGAMRAAGFADVTTEEVEHPFRFASADQWWAFAWSHGMRGRLEALAPDELERARAAAYREMARMAAADGSLSLRQRVCYAIGHVR